MEGPSLVILKEQFKPFIGRKIAHAEGNVKLIDVDALNGRTLTQVRTWGKHFLMKIGPRWLKVHFLMFGSCWVDSRNEEKIARLSLRFSNGHEANFYNCSIRELESEPSEIYHWSVDPMAREWDELKAIRKVRAHPELYVCDVLLDQTIFSGVGNIIKNEVLFRLGIHPLTLVGQLKPRQVARLVSETRKYCFEFYTWKKAFVLKKNWKIYRRPECAGCKARPLRRKTGVLERVSFYCETCQPLIKLEDQGLGRQTA